MGMRTRDSTHPTANAATPAMTVIGRRIAKTIGLRADDGTGRPPTAGRSFLVLAAIEMPPARRGDGAARCRSLTCWLVGVWSPPASSTFRRAEVGGVPT